ncbi:MAG: histidine ammonia-lyase [Phycisphaerales bacterium]|nr:histidine ammonia-lyase [Phycisphaerales bacterium]
MAKPVRLDGSGLGIGHVAAVAREGAGVSITPAARSRVLRSRKVVEGALRDGKPHYGINTGFGALAKQRIGSGQLAELQLNLVRSHSAGVGEPLPEETVRATMLVLAASLCRGMSGVRPAVPETIVAMLNAGVTPVVPSVGSVGASGDLAPLAAIALVAVGEGRAMLGGREMKGAEALRKTRIRPLTLGAKEGLALINGTHLMAASGALLCGDAAVLLRAGHAALAMSIDACRASHEFLDRRLYDARGHSGAAEAAMETRRLLAGSAIRRSHLKDDPRVQDPYSLRAGPTVHGAAVWAIAEITRVIAAELGAVTDNPLVLAKGPIGVKPRMEDTPGDAVLSGANFHGMPIALPLDCLAIALCHLAGISERRTYLMTGAFEPESHLKPFLAPRPGLQSGLMVAQYAAAACVNEMIGLAVPASVANIPTCAGMEDYNSFGPRAAAKARRSLDLASRVIAVELLCAAQGLEAHRPLRSGRGVERAYRAVRDAAPPLSTDRPLTGDIERLAQRVREGAFAL